MIANWNYPTAIRVGPGRLAELSALCRELGFERPLFVTDPAIEGMQFFQKALSDVQTSGIKAGVFSTIRANPTAANIEQGTAVFRSNHHDGVIAIGGGSALDAGKTIALMARQACDLWDLEDVGDNWLNADKSQIVPIIAIPTTAGTGSEVGRAALIVNEAELRKVIIFHPAMLPRTVILDPLTTLGLPAHLTAATGMDALSHNLEAFCSPVFHPMAEGIAVEAIRMISLHLPAAVADGQNVDAREQMLVASMMGATAFQRGLGAMHALAHPLGAVYDAHHGLLNAVLMPYVLMANRTAIEQRIGRLAKSIGLAADFDAFLAWVLKLREDLGIPPTLASFIAADDRYAAIGEMAFVDPSAGTNPLPFTARDYQRLAGNALNGVLDW
ncbi:MAG: iron-containing alcohol dehydrogenase [Proteobacteria bacterium]|nr:iron-containing alcohol dehydrogenase [Pseudomonadota bacterium]